MGGIMKNTGKRIFAVATAFVVMNLGLAVLAGVHLSQR